MIGTYQDFMDYVNMDLWNWTIKEDAPDWAKQQFNEYMEEQRNKDER